MRSAADARASIAKRWAICWPRCSRPPGPSGGALVTVCWQGSAEAAWEAAAAVPDPEVPCVTVADLGILRWVRLEDGVAVAGVTPTYSGCPAVLAIELAIEAALRDAGFEARIERVLTPPWTTDWITEEGREKLRDYGIAPPGQILGLDPVALRRSDGCLPEMRQHRHREAERVRIDRLQGTLPLPRLCRAFRLFQVHLTT